MPWAWTTTAPNYYPRTNQPPYGNCANPAAIRLSRRARNNIKINIALSLAVVAILVIAALAGWMTLTTGLPLNEGSAALIILNGLRVLLPGRGKTRHTRTWLGVSNKVSDSHKGPRLHYARGR